MGLFVGTSGYNYDAWKGSFYPDKLSKAKMLAYYASQFASVEINYTFRTLPTEKVLANWAAQVPKNFRFALKAPQSITHHKRLIDCGEPLLEFAQLSERLGARRGPILFQLPPNLKVDAERLRAFLEILPRGLSSAFEFRHESWFSDEIYKLLSNARAALCIADTDDLSTPLIKTAPYGYFRLRREDYDKKAIARWAKRIAALKFRGDVHVYFKHEDDALGPRFARQLLDILTPWSGRGP